MSNGIVRSMRADQSHRLDPALITLAAPKLPRAGVKACSLQLRAPFGSPRTGTDLVLINALAGHVGTGVQLGKSLAIRPKVLAGLAQS
jgi:hypothetical protein